MSDKQKRHARECHATRTTQKCFSFVPILLCLLMTSSGNCQFQFQNPWYNTGSYQPLNFQPQTHYQPQSVSHNQFPFVAATQYPVSSPTQYPEASQTQYPASTGSQSQYPAVSSNSQSQYPVISSSQTYFPLASISQSKYPVISTSQPPVSSSSQPSHYPVTSDSKYPVLSGQIQQTVVPVHKPTFQKPIKESVANQTQLFIGFPLPEKEDNQWWLFSPVNSESIPDQPDSGLNQVDGSGGQGQDHKNSHQSPSTTIG